MTTTSPANPAASSTTSRRARTCSACVSPGGVRAGAAVLTRRQIGTTIAHEFFPEVVDYYLGQIKDDDDDELDSEDEDDDDEDADAEIDLEKPKTKKAKHA
jgi:hypothetical protein